MRSRQNRCRRRHQDSRAAIAAVEFAIVAPIMILFVFGLIELGRLMMVKNAATHASREGARIAVTPAADADEVRTRVEELMAAYTIENATVTVDPPLLEFAENGDMVTVGVSIDANSVSWIGDAFFLPVTDIMASTTMRRESSQ